MIEKDTVKLLRECDAGVQMGTSSIDDVLSWVRADPLRQSLSECRNRHQQLSAEIRTLLHRYHDRGKRPAPLARKMSGLMTDVKMTLHESDRTVADLMTDGCNMGVKNLSRYLNQYKAADETSKDIAKRLIRLEENLARDIRGYL